MKYKTWLQILIFSLFLISTQGAAHAWWNEGWQYRKKITLDTTVNGSNIKENLMDVPVLVRLHTGNFDFSAALEEGDDIRFVAADDMKLLKHHIERYDIIDEMALIWVKLPRLSAQTDQDFLWMYYGNKEAMGGQDAKATFDAAQAAVFHLGELDKTPMDAGANNQVVDYFAGGQGLPSVIGSGITLNGAGDRMVIADSPTLNFADGFTFSAWLRMNQQQNDAVLFNKAADGNSILIGIDGTRIYSKVTNGESEVAETEKSADIPLNQWVHVMVTAAPGKRMTIYLDGLEMIYVNIGDRLPEIAADCVIGAMSDGSHGYAGDIDEIRLSTTARPEAWARAAFASQGPDGRFYTFGVEELGGGSGGMPVFYLGTILKNITLDGWVIITMLILLMLASWIIFISKIYFLYIGGKENKQFVSEFNTMDNPLENYDPENGYDNSSLYAVYAEGCRTLLSGSQGGDVCQSEGGIKKFKTALESAFVTESRRLNGRVLVLTLAITGGPFLGLLGTVWGVMNTFAALAEAGEANIMAIAPGVASALATTVFGLIVAIPALFAYNILASQIKNITADLTVFIDQFTLKVDQGQGGTA